MTTRASPRCTTTARATLVEHLLHFTMDSTPGTQTLVFWWFFDFYTLKSFFSAACTMQQGTRVQTKYKLATPSTAIRRPACHHRYRARYLA